MECCVGHDDDPGAGLVEVAGWDGLSDKAIIALRRSLMESEQKANLWKEQADETRTEYIQCKSNARVLQVELDSTQKKLARVQEECKMQGHLIEELRREIARKNSERSMAEDPGHKYNAKALKTELKSTQEELTQIKEEYGKQRRLVDELRKDRKQIRTAKEPESSAKRPAASKEEQAERANQTRERLLQDYAMAKQLDEELNARKDTFGRDVPSNFDRDTYHRRPDVHSAPASNLLTGPVQSQIEMARAEIATLKKEVERFKLSEVRGKELEDAQVFLTQADVTDVIKKVNALNEEIFQMAAFLGEVLIYEALEPDANRQEHRQAAVESTYEIARNTLGQTLASTLAHESMNDPKEESNPLLVQIVMQTALTNWCDKFGRRWTSYQRVDNESENEAKEGQPKDSGSKSGISKQLDHDRFVSELYDSIRDHEDQAIAGRWRSLTKAHLPFSTAGWDHSLMLAICSIMSVAGWGTRSDGDIAQVEKRLSSIFKTLLDLRKATGEDVTSADLEISIIQPGQTFDPTYMEDAYADGRSSSKSKKSAPEAVISTSGLGLQRLVVKRSKAGGVQRQLEILFMPKVVLEKTIKEALEPPPPAKKKKKVTLGRTGLS
ncbi:hypothetical protein EST38_g12596 [Candolleomyces aberdarensis]|uniref:Uncharacterized protein n=1 Tax=Candolleomyces aberdarensis TaxID=2316362 RepID=A0A4Q2D415_9AGAR|nr:hypothetical protein EST38_g12596 [Candolleomyces aberdarensis]